MTETALRPDGKLGQAPVRGEMMSLPGRSWSKSIAAWWVFLLIVSGLNVIGWLVVSVGLQNGGFRFEPLILLSAVYVFGCAFRAVLPRADVQRICLFDTGLSSVMLGRSVATVAELAFIGQWAIVLHSLAVAGDSDFARAIALAIIPLIIIAECCSWYAVISTNYLGNVLENSLWAFAFLLIAAGLVLLLGKFQGIVQLLLSAALVGTIGYVLFMLTVDVPMYFKRWRTDMARGKALLGFVEGLRDVTTNWIVTREFKPWREEISWMSLYFSAAVWSSLALCGFLLVNDSLHEYRHGAGRSDGAIA